MPEVIEEVQQVFKGKKGIYLAAGVAVVAVVAVVLRSRSTSTTSAGVGTDSSLTGASVATAAPPVDNSAIESQVGTALSAMQSHFDDTNATLTSSINTMVSDSAAQETEINVLQSQLNTAIAGGGTVTSIGSVAGSSNSGQVQNYSGQSNSVASGSSIPVFTSTPHHTTDADLGKILNTSTGPSGNGLVTVKTSNGTATVAAGSVFDPSSANYNPNL